MILTVGQYIEAICNPEGRFRTLQGVYPLADADGRPVFSVPGHGLADFEIMAGGARNVMRCPLRAGTDAENKLRALAGKDRSTDSRFFTPWQTREKEIVLFDTAGQPIEQDVLVRPAAEGVDAGEFLRHAAAKDDTSIIMSALAEIAELAEWSRLMRRKISVRRLLFSAGGRVCADGFSATDELAAVALAFLFTAAMPGKLTQAGLPLLARAEPHPLAVRLCAEAAAAGFPEPARILAGDVEGPLRTFAVYTPQRVAELGKCLEQLVVQVDPATEPIGDYDWGGGGICGCVKDAGGRAYMAVNEGAAAAGMALIPMAVFREGRAEVETSAGKGLIDTEGRFILEPIYEEVVWDDYWGLAAVMFEGRWSLLDRQGTLLTEKHYDWLGECCEGLVLAQKNGKCGFLDAQGCEAIPFVYDDATSFREGVSFVTRGEENFFIDPKGVRVPCENFEAAKS